MPKDVFFVEKLHCNHCKWCLQLHGVKFDTCDVSEHFYTFI